MLVDTSALPAVLTLRVELRPTGDRLLPAFLGSALHGALGRALWRTVCAFRSRSECRGCPLFARCPYPALFAASAPRRSAIAENGAAEQVPRPMVLAPEPGWTRPSGRLRPVDSTTPIPFRLTLIGPAREDLALIVVVLKAMAERGIGRALGRPAAAECSSDRHCTMTLDRVAGLPSGQTVYDGETGLLRHPAEQRLAPDPEPRDSATVEVVTPLRIKSAGSFVSRPSPAVFFQALAHRANMLSLLYGAGRNVASESAVAEAAGELETIGRETRLVCVRRFSGRQNRLMTWPGIVGCFRWRGASLKELWPLLRFGEAVQVGKGTTLGFGRYVMVEDSPIAQEFANEQQLSADDRLAKQARACGPQGRDFSDKSLRFQEDDSPNGD